MLLFMVPVFVEAETILTIWLGKAPEHSAMFLRFALFESLAIQSGTILLKLVFADGKVKIYQICCSLFVCGGFPISWIIMHFGGPVWTPYAVFIFLYFAVEIVRFYTIKKTIPLFSIRSHVFDVLKPCIITTIVSFSIPLFVQLYFDQSFVRFLILLPISFIWVAFCNYIFGLSNGEKSFVCNKVKELKHKFI